LWIKENKEQIDKLIGSIFEEIASASARAVASTSEATNGKWKHEEIEDEPRPQSSPEKPISAPRPAPAAVLSPVSKRPAPPKPPTAKLEESKDAEIARQLAAELNSPRTRSSGSEKRSTKKARPKKKSAAQIGSDDEGGETTKKASKGGFQKEYTLSAPLSLLVQSPKLSRTQIVKKLWEYIKAHNLQDPANKRDILCDPMMKAVFNVDKINMFQMNKELGQHLYDEHEK